MLRKIVPALVLLLFAAAPAAGQWRQQALARLASDAEVLTDRGYSMGDVFTNSLNNGYHRDHTIQLTRGVTYAILGECDDDCTDIDFELYDATGRLIDSDLLTDDTPIVEVTPRYTGAFRLRVKMATCSTNPCWYGVGLFSQ